VIRVEATLANFLEPCGELNDICIVPALGTHELSAYVAFVQRWRLTHFHIYIIIAVNTFF